MLWTYTDNTGVERLGTVERTSDHGGSDVTYYMRRQPDPDSSLPGKLDVLSGSWMKAHNAMPIAYAKDQT